MAYEMIIDVGQEGERIALLKDKKLVELHQGSPESGSFQVGEIYLGKVKKIMPGLNAAFVDIGHAKDAFLHYHDLGPYIKSWLKITDETLEGKRTSGNLDNFSMEPETVKTGKISQVLKRNQQILVQVAKEPISSKGPRLTTEISIAGRYFILVPFYDTVNVSKKVSTLEERKRLKNLGNSLKAPKLGLICRTAAEQKGGQDLHQDIMELQGKWEDIFKKLPNAQPRDKVLGEAQKSFAILRDLLSYDFAAITINQKLLYEAMKEHLQTIDPNLPKVLRHYSGKEDIFSQFGIDKQIQSSFGKTVSCQGGAYLIIEHTEALHSIDVNSGSKQARSSNQEENALAANLDAAREIARQLRLRDMGGIVVIDFIDLRTPNFKKQLWNTLSEAMADDKAKHTILPMSKFGLIQITRQRVRPEMSISTAEKCPTCLGTGTVTSSVLISDDIESNLDYLITAAKHKNLTVLTNPYLAAYIKQGAPSKRLHWFFKYKIWVKVKVDIKQGMLDYTFLDGQGETIDLDKQ
jgi:ribonuclease G|tara:strand:+ start:4934 stop:6496 length:1563 start_codon:yes stop_codon:yes gene_type:complete